MEGTRVKLEVWVRSGIPRTPPGVPSASVAHIRDEPGHVAVPEVTDESDMDSGDGIAAQASDVDDPLPSHSTERSPKRSKRVSSSSRRPN